MDEQEIRVFSEKLSLDRRLRVGANGDSHVRKEEPTGAGILELAARLERFAAKYHSQGEYEKAEPLYQEALRIRIAQLGQLHLDVASSLNNLGRLHHDKGNYAQAELLYRRSLFIVQEPLGRQHPKLATRLANLAELYASQKKILEFKDCQERLLALREAVSSPGYGKLANLQEKWCASENNFAASAQTEPMPESDQPF